MEHETDTWPFQAYVNDEGHLAVSKHDADSGACGELIFHNDINGDVEVEVRRFDEALFGSVKVNLR